jgi:hypothetical protein
MRSSNLFYVESLSSTLIKRHSLFIHIDNLDFLTSLTSCAIKLIRIKPNGTLRRCTNTDYLYHRCQLKVNQNHQIREIKPILEPKQPINKSFFKAIMKAKRKRKKGKGR